MYAQPDITIVSLSEQTGVSVASVNKYIKQLTQNGYIRRNEQGNWHLIITPSI